MATYYLIDVESAPDTEYTVTLDDDTYVIRLQYMLRSTNLSTTEVTADMFLMQMKLSGDDDWAIRTSLKTNRDVLAQYHHLDACPAGKLMLRDYAADAHYYATGGAYSPERVNYDDLGTRFKLFYVSDD